MKIRPVGAELFNADRRTDGLTWWSSQSLFADLIWYYVIYLTEIGLTPGGSSTYLHTKNSWKNRNKKIHITTHYRRKTIHRTTQFTN